MNRIQQLDDLQRIDLQIEENQKARRQLEAHLSDHSVLTNAQQALGTADKQEKEARARLSSLELENKSLDEHIKNVDSRLYGGQVGNPKELAGLERDEGMLKRQKKELEDRILDEMARLEEAESSRARQAAAASQVAQTRQAEETTDRDHLDKVVTTLSQLGRQRDEMTARISVGDLQVYEGLIKSKKGRAVAHIKGAACSACGFAIPSGLASRARVGEELVFCVNCERILVP